jgi:hypothetical protein
MSYMNSFLKTYGQDCTIARIPDADIHILMKRTTKAINDLATHDSYFDGIVEGDNKPISGDILTVDGNKYIVQSVIKDYRFAGYSIFIVKTNSVITYKDKTPCLDSNNNVTYSWESKYSNIDVFMLIITGQMRIYDIGLLESTRYLCQIPKSYTIQKMGRVVYNGENYQIVSIDDSGLEGVNNIQLAADIRSD